MGTTDGQDGDGIGGAALGPQGCTSASWAVEGAGSGGSVSGVGPNSGHSPMRLRTPGSRRVQGLGWRRGSARRRSTAGSAGKAFFRASWTGTGTRRNFRRTTEDYLALGRLGGRPCDGAGAGRGRARAAWPAIEAESGVDANVLAAIWVA